MRVLALVLVVTSPVWASGEQTAPDSRPNILFIYTDDQSYRTVSCYPEAFDWVHTPNVDRLAEEGIRFTHAYIGTWCMPSRSTMLTGLHPYGVRSMRMEGTYPGSTYDPEECPFWPAVFRENGYFTAQIGKWHTGTDTGFGRDWDDQIVWNRPAHPENSTHYYDDQLISRNGGAPELVKGYSTDNYTRWAVEFIRERHRDPGRPWYLWLCYGAVHGPYTPAERHLERYLDARVPTPRDIYRPRPGKPAYVQELDRWVRGEDGEPRINSGRGRPGKTLTEAVRRYHQAALALDEGVKRLMTALEETGQRRNTLVVYTSDQGFAWGQHGFRDKLAPYDATIRAPLIVSMPGTLPEGTVCRSPVGGADLIPTFFRFAGIGLPWRMHGHDLTPLLRHPEGEWPHPVLMTLTGASYGADTDRVPASGPKLFRGPGVPWWVSLRRGRYKYIRTLVEAETEELYDLEDDPEELTNLALEPEHATRLKRLREATIAELERTGAKMARRLPAVRAAR